MRPVIKVTDKGVKKELPEKARGIKPTTVVTVVSMMGLKRL